MPCSPELAARVERRRATFAAEPAARDAGEPRRREAARARFQAADYARAAELLGGLRYPAFMTPAERRMSEFARRRAGGLKNH